MNRLTRHEVADLRRKVRAVVNASDPMGLLGDGCPEDEYDAEVDQICAAPLRGHA